MALFNNRIGLDMENEERTFGMVEALGAIRHLQRETMRGNPYGQVASAYILGCMNSAGVAWPSVDNIRSTTGVSFTKWKKAKKALAKYQHILILGRKDPGQGRKSIFVWRDHGESKQEACSRCLAKLLQTKRPKNTPQDLWDGILTTLEWHASNLIEEDPISEPSPKQNPSKAKVRKSESSEIDTFGLKPNNNTHTPLQKGASQPLEVDQKSESSENETFAFPNFRQSESSENEPQKEYHSYREGSPVVPEKELEQEKEEEVEVRSSMREREDGAELPPPLSFEEKSQGTLSTGDEERIIETTSSLAARDARLSESPPDPMKHIESYLLEKFEKFIKARGGKENVLAETKRITSKIRRREWNLAQTKDLIEEHWSEIATRPGSELLHTRVGWLSRNLDEYWNKNKRSKPSPVIPRALTGEDVDRALKQRQRDLEALVARLEAEDSVGGDTFEGGIDE